MKFSILIERRFRCKIEKVVSRLIMKDESNLNEEKKRCFNCHHDAVMLRFHSLVIA